MSTKYRNPASVARDRVLELSSQWNRAGYSASGDSDSGSSSGKQKPGKGLIEKPRSDKAHYAEEEDANLGDPDAEWKSGNAHYHSKGRGSAGSQSEDEKAKQTQPKGSDAQKYAKEEDDSLKPENTGAPTKEAMKSGKE